MMLDDSWNGQADLRRAFSRFATGVTVVTTHDAELGPVGFTANSFASVSLAPPLVLWSISNSATRHDVFAGAQSFAIHVLSEAQQDVAQHFVQEGGGFDSYDWEADAVGVPLLHGCLARFACEMHQTVSAGDHTIMIGRVTGLAQREGAGLAYMNSRFGTFTTADG